MKTWKDIEEASLHNALCREAVTRVELGQVTREQALIHLALALMEFNTKLKDGLLVCLMESSKHLRPMESKGEKP